MMNPTSMGPLDLVMPLYQLIRDDPKNRRKVCNLLHWYYCLRVRYAYEAVHNGNSRAEQIRLAVNRVMKISNDYVLGKDVRLLVLRTLLQIARRDLSFCINDKENPLRHRDGLPYDRR